MLIANSLHVLCFGDSLTHGMTEHGTVYHPYALALNSTLQHAFPRLQVVAEEHGQDGDLVSGPGYFLPRMNALYEEVHPGNPFDWAITLGGTNDVIGWHKSAIETYEAFQKIWAVPLSHGTKVLALTIPECGHCGSEPELMEQRRVYNAMILSHRAKNFYTFDLGTAVPFFAMPAEKRNEIWEDTIHFTAKGYDTIGALLAKRIVELIVSGDLEANQQTELKR